MTLDEFQVQPICNPLLCSLSFGLVASAISWGGAHPEFRHEPSFIGSNGCGADAPVIGDFLVADTLRKQLKNLLFAVAERFDRVCFLTVRQFIPLLDQVGGDGCR